MPSADVLKKRFYRIRKPQNVDTYGIMKVPARRLQHLTGNTGNLIVAGCGGVILPRFAPPASVSYGGFFVSSSPLLFGQFDLAPLYHQIVNSYTADLGKAEGNVLYAAICLATVTGGVITDPETMRPADLRVLYQYCSENGALFYDAAERLLDNEVLQFACSARDRVYALHAVVFDDVCRAHRRFPRPALIVSKKKAAPRTLAEMQMESNPRAGYVYIAAAENGLYKIGKSKNPEQRVKGFAGAIMPFEIKLLHAIYATDMHLAESTIHQQYRHCRRAGEWFQLSNAEIDELLSLQVFDEAA